MNRTLNEIDKTLSDSKSKMKSDFERSLRGLNFGKLYLKNGEYETALKYVKNYLSVRPNSSEGHKLLAQVYEAIGEDESALLNYRKALDLKKNSNENYLSSIQPTMSTPSMSEMKKQIENNSNPSVESTPIRIQIKEKTPEMKENKCHPCGTCANQSVLNKMAKQNDTLIEANKIILDILKQNNSNINNIEKKMVWITETLNSLTDSQNLMKDTLYDFMAQEENEGFDDYLLDDKENESLDTSALLGANNSSQSGQWHSSGLQLMPNLEPNRPLSELFKPAADSWKCDACYVQNNGSDMMCAACTTPKPGAAIEPTVVEPIKTNFGFGNAQPFSFKAPSNTSTGFTFGAVESNPTIESNSIFSNTNFKFGNSTFNPTLNSISSPPEFILKSSQPNENKSPQNIFSNNQNSKVGSFQFGLSRTFDFEFPKFGSEGPAKPSNIVESPPKFKEEEANTSLNESYVEPSNADNIYFQPVVPLPPKVEVKTGEEEENVLHSVRARLYRFSDNEWKERGVGDIKILESRESNRIRLLMRRETIFKVCLNQYITHDLKLDLKEDKKTISWSAIDYSEDTPVPQIFLLRLKNMENAHLFLQAVENAKSNLNTSSQSTESNDSITTKEIESTNESRGIATSNESNVISGNEDDIEIVYEKIPESEEILRKVLELKLPLNFYDYENMEPCPGCRGCDNNMPLFTKSQPKSMEKIESQDSTEDSLFHSAIAATNISQTDWHKSNSGQKLWQSSAPTPIFSSPRSPSQDDDTVPPNPDIYFKPLIPLPDLVEVKTGEEEETPIYCQRAKLYRYDPQTKEWKERGVGDFKILKHNSKNRFRMILRRDQILKIACNHYISSSMDLKPMNTSETAICWNTIDYTDGTPTEEQFALKFKNRDILQNFTKVFNDCKTGLEDTNDSFNENTSSFNGGAPDHH